MPRNPNKQNWSGGLPASLEAFSVIEDPRAEGTKKHHFGEILFLCLVAMLCGMNTFAEVEDFAYLRSLISTNELSALDGDLRDCWPSLASIIAVENKTTELPSVKARKKESRYEISSLKELADKLLKKICTHWSLENNCHRVLDVVFRKDHNETHIENSAKNLGTLRRILPDILESEDSLKGSLPKKQRHCLLDFQYREKLPSLI